MNSSLGSSSVERSSFLIQSLADGIKKFDNLDLRDVILKKAVIVDVSFNGANLTGANFNSVKLIRNVSFKGSILDRSSFVRSLLRDCNFEGASLRKANFQSSKFSSVFLTSADLTDANFNHAKLTNTDFEGATLSGTGLEAPNIKSADSVEAISPDFIQQCQEILMELVGPISKLLIQQSIQASSSKDKAFFINEISRQITDKKSSEIFETKVRGLLGD